MARPEGWALTPLVLSLRYRSGLPEVWSPVGDSFLLWDQTDTGSCISMCTT